MKFKCHITFVGPLSSSDKGQAVQHDAEDPLLSDSSHHPLAAPMPCHIKSLAVPQITTVFYLAFAYDFLPPQRNVPFSTPNFNLAFNSWLRCYFFQEVFLLKDWAKHLPHTAHTMLTQTPESKIKPITKVTERGRDFLQVRTFLKAFPPQLILKG